MSLLPPDVQAAILQINDNVDTILADAKSFQTRLNQALDRVDIAIDKATPLVSQAIEVVGRVNNIENQINKIENLLFAILIVVLVMVSIMFTYWFFGHIWPIISGDHKHEHNFKNVLKDLGTSTIRFTRAL